MPNLAMTVEFAKKQIPKSMSSRKVLEGFEIFLQRRNVYINEYYHHQCWTFSSAEVKVFTHENKKQRNSTKEKTEK